ncbi:MAG: hypothetical protein KF729_16215 [Sandaracinaceae bacterium]|nr:hypothetical protein [Sandaracinaceae bacterium]
MNRRWLAMLSLCLLACDGPAPVPDAGAADAGAPPSSAVRFELNDAIDTHPTFFDLPFPSDLRLDAHGRPELTGYPNPRIAVITNLLPVAASRPGWPTVPVGYFRFGAPLAPRRARDRIDASPAAPVLLVDVDPRSPDRGALFATIAETFDPDLHTGENLLGVAAYPGLVLAPERTYAFVVLRSFGDAGGARLEVAPPLADLAAGRTPAGARGPAAAALYAPLFETLDGLGVPRAEVAAATVFTTGDVVAQTRALSERVLAGYAVTVEGLALDPSDGARHERYCELLATVSQPQFQRGVPPFDTEGELVVGPDGAPVEQRRESTRLVLTVPKREMPEAGFPLMVYFHGSGGVAAQVVDRGPHGPGGRPAVGLGPAHMIAEHGFASAGAALPISPDRVPGASSIAYINFDNLAAFPSTFRQGVFEQRLLIRALAALEIPPAALEGCDGPTLPPGASAFRFDPDAFVALGQSMGGMYTNMIGAVEPRLRALVPTGAGGLWSYFILETSLIDGVRGLLGGLLRADGEALTHLHPALSLLELAWEPAEPLAYVPRLARRPLPDVPARPVFQPVGLGDSYFPPAVFDAMALAYGHRQAGEIVWPSMQESLSLAGLGGIAPYPVADNLENARGERTTGVVVQSAGDGFSDPHDIFVQVPEIRRQWGCFLRSALDGAATLVAPAAPGSPCGP